MEFSGTNFVTSNSYSSETEWNIPSPYNPKIAGSAETLFP
jgi:hypothetical protein